MRATKIVIGIPAYKGKLSVETLAGLADLNAHSCRFNADPIFIPRVIPNKYCNCTGRNKAIYNGNYKAGWLPDFDYFFSTDADMDFSAGLIRGLVKIAKENSNNCIVSAAYLNRHIDTEIVAGTWANDGRPLGEFTIDMFNKTFERGKEYTRLGWCGLGACLIPSNVIMMLPAPLFRHRYFENPLSGEIEELEDDLSFCKALSEIDIPVLLSGFKVKHEGKVF